MTPDEQAAFDFAMDHYGFDREELTPDRERLVRRSSIYQWRLLHIKVVALGRDITAVFVPRARRLLDRFHGGDR